MSLTMTIEIPALDRLCDWLESKAGMAEAIESEIVQKLKEAAGSGTLEKAAKSPEGKKELPHSAAPTAPSGREPEKAPEPEPKAEPEPKPVTLDAVQRAAAQMRDDGKLKAVTDMFPEFGIKKLSDLKGEKLQAFADRLRAMGAKI